MFSFSTSNNDKEASDVRLLQESFKNNMLFIIKTVDC